MAQAPCEPVEAPANEHIELTTFRSPHEAGRATVGCRQRRSRHGRRTRWRSSRGHVWRRASLLVAAAVLVLPASIYLTATPRFRYVGLFPVAFHLIAAQAVRRERVWIGVALVVVVGAFFGWLAWIVVTQ